MRRLVPLLLASLALAACGESRPRGPAAFDEAMRRLQDPERRPPGLGLAPGSTVVQGQPVRGGPRRTVIDLGLAGRGPARSPGPLGAAEAGGGSVTLNFVEAPVPQVVQAVLGDLLRTDYTIDPRVSGTVTLQTQRPVPQAAALSLLESALEVNNAALVRGGTGYRVVPLEDAMQAGPPVGLRAAGAVPGPGFAIVALPVTNARAADLQRVLQPLAPRGGTVIADEARNVLLLAGTGPQLATLLDTAESFDVDWLRGQSMALLPLENAPAALVAQEIGAVFSAEGGRQALRIVPVSRMNALLVVTTQPQQLERVRRWVRELDAGLGGSPQLFVHRIQYVRATDLANTLRQLLQGNARGGAGAPLLAPGLPGALAAAGGTLAVAAGGAPGLVPGGLPGAMVAGGVPNGGMPGGLAPGAVPGGGEAPGLPPVLPGSIPGALAGGLPGEPPPPLGGAAGGLPAAPVRIVADEGQNAVIVYASQADWRLVERAILLLDRPPSQVAIDAIIAEVTLNDDLEYGLSWYFRSGLFEFSLTAGNSPTPSPSFPGFNILYSGNTDARVVLHALATMTDVRVISSPQVMVLSNQTARLRVGDSVPIVTQQATGGGITDSRIVNSVQLRDTGVSLDVTPRVNAAGGVLLEVDQDVSDAVRTTTSGIDSPTIQQRRLRSMVSVPNGETVALGGLIRESDTRSRTGLPFVDQVPVLRDVLGVTSRARRRTELLVLLTPRVVQTTEDLRRVTEELRSRMRSMQPRDEPPRRPNAPPR
ncbi:type II secretion system secretin GspD [Siccirubricoccus sp. G192]|uniref:type II secretion system secretin GspD n=1 Tax=Siccirubricoccus sp. G192 TaxID=2849651 RepID=UPI001C2C374A|nr:type II secretion system secretin GspD [Siccirubricoccus sp. G192]MBV1800152.1 type II secretion system secretin GspD [Siccirubricoccus sp. G192]